MHHEAASDNDDSKRRLEVISFYNTTKGGFETADKMLWGYLSKAASRRWPLAVFFNHLDIACLTAYVFCKNKGIQSFSRRKFLLQLGEALCDAEGQRRKKGTSRFATAVNQSGAAELPGNIIMQHISEKKNPVWDVQFVRFMSGHIGKVGPETSYFSWDLGP